jgi:LSD1 subclass zinc finger protein
MTDLCPSCREPLHYPSGDGCAAMTLHQPVKGMVMSAAIREGGKCMWILLLIQMNAGV